jgi:pimeloyl-ACP methyl ester carboxylesterase
VPKVRVNGVELYYEVHGNGEPLLLLAGFACDHTPWSLAAPALAAHHRVILLDSRGTGHSEAGDGPTGLRQMADDAVGLLDHLGLARVDVAGHSMGGQIAQELALSYPGRVRGLALVATWARLDARVRSLTELCGELAGKLDPATYQRVILPWVFSRAFFETPGAIEQVIALWLTPPSPPSPEVLYRQSRAALAADTSSRAGAIRCPTLVLVGAEDILTPPRLSEELARLIPDARLKMVPGASHNFIVEMPAAATAILLDFLSSQ